MRLSYCYPAPERIREGVRRLVGVIEEELDLRDTFGPMPLRQLEAVSNDAPGPDVS
jgi:hypothetical protein